MHGGPLGGLSARERAERGEEREAVGVVEVERGGRDGGVQERAEVDDSGEVVEADGVVDATGGRRRGRRPGPQATRSRGRRGRSAGPQKLSRRLLSLIFLGGGSGRGFGGGNGMEEWVWAAPSPFSVLLLLSGRIWEDGEGRKGRMWRRGSVLVPSWSGWWREDTGGAAVGGWRGERDTPDMACGRTAMECAPK